MSKLLKFVLIFLISFLIVGCGGKYSIVYDFDGGLVEEEYSSSFTFPSKIKLPTPVKEGYIFIGFKEDGNYIEKFSRKNYVLKAFYVEEFSYPVISENDIFNQDEKEYLVYFYRDGCTYCDDIEVDIKRYIYKQELSEYSDSLKIYPVNLTLNNVKASIFRSYEGKGQGSNKNFYVNGLTSIENMHIPSTPSLIKITSKVSKFVASGASKVKDELNLKFDPSKTDNTVYKINYEFNGGKAVDNYTTEFTNPFQIKLPTLTKDNSIFIGFVSEGKFITSFEKKDYNLVAIFSDTFEYDLITEDNLFNQEESEYFVYLYREDCSWCELAKEDILKYIYKTSLPQYSKSIKVYAINLMHDDYKASIFRTYTGEDGQGSNKTLYVDNLTSIENMYIPSTPTLIKIEKVNNIKTAFFKASGKTNVINELNKGLVLDSSLIGNEYTITYDYNGGNVYENFAVSKYYNWLDFSLPIPKKAGYCFVGWYEGEEKVVKTKSKNYNLVARYEKVIESIDINSSEIFNQKEEVYYIVFYKDYISKDIIDAFNTLYAKVYLVDFGKEINNYINIPHTDKDGQGDQGIFYVDNVTVWTDLKIPRTPSVIKVVLEEGKLKSYFESTSYKTYFENILYK